MSRNRFYLGFTAVFLLLTSACVQHNEKTVTEQLPPPRIENTFSLKDKSSLRLQKSSLGKLFLLRATMKSLKNSPSWDDLKPMIVSFQKSDDQLGMFEMDTYSTYDVIDTKRLVTKFQITSETDTEIQFEWGEGLKVVARPFYDDTQTAGDPSENESQKGLDTSLETIASFVKSSELRNNQLHLQQAIRVKFSVIRMKAQNPLKPDEKTPSLETKEGAGEVDYVLKPYVVNTRFKPKEIDPLNRVGFFKTTVGQATKSESKTAYATHWDLSPEAGPITFALSKHFPPEILKAVKEGILYWNIVLGAEKIKVVENFEPESDFPDRTVVVNWLPWTDAGSSWANFQADPLTGEIFRGQIYITSVFLDLSQVYPETSDEQTLSLAGMTSSRVCHYPAQTFNYPAQATDRKKQQYLADQLRHVLAHEAGHTLGLRHNFAGSMDSELKIAEINTEKKKYETDINFSGAALTSTIMDYIRGLEEGMIGRWIQTKPLGYDVDALAWVSSDQEEAKTKYAFCTDDDIVKAVLANEKVFGCERFDSPANPFSVRAEETQRVMSQLVQMKFNTLLEAMYPANSTRVRELESVLNEDYAATSASLMSGRSSISSAISLPLSYIYNESGLKTSQKVVYFKNRTQKRWDSKDTSVTDILRDRLTEVGGIGPLLKSILPADDKGFYDASFFSNQIKALQESPRFSKGVTASGRSYELTSEEQARIVQYLQKGADSMDSTIQSTLVWAKPFSDQETTEDGKTVKNSKTVPYGIGQDQWFPDAAKVFKMMILSQKETKTEPVEGKNVTYKTNSVMSYYRMAFAQMLSPFLWNAYSAPKTEAIETRAELLSRIRALYQQVSLPADLAPPTSDLAADHEAFLAKIDSQKLPTSIKTIVSEDIMVLKELEKFL